MMKFLCDFKKLSKNDTALGGGKGASLGEMAQAGIPVPHGFVLLTTAFEKFLEESDLLVEIDSILHSIDRKKVHTIENASEKIKALMLSAKIPEDIGEEIQKSFKNLNAKYVAVRSSATTEDSASAAWAGQLESYLNTTEKNLLQNVKKCWASLFTPRAIFYRFEKDLHKQKISVAVVVQKMVESEKSGIAFSVHPITQDRNQLIIEAGLGLGEAIVSGQITPDSYVVEKQPRRIIDRNVEVQKRGLYRAKKGGNEWRDILREQGEKQILSDQEILKLSELVLKIENHYGFPCDIEWVFAEGEFHIVQSRPITTLGNRDSVSKKQSEIGNLSDYTRLFRFPTLPYLLNDMLLKNYLPLKCLFLFKDNVWISYIPNEVVTRTKKDGVKLFGSRVLFKEWNSGFEKYKKDAQGYFDKLIRKNEFSRKEIETFFNHLCNCHYFYIKTEFFYTDLVYKLSTENKTIEENLKKFEHIKNSGRAFLNEMVLEPNNYLVQTLCILGKQFSVSPTELFQYSINEISNLFVGNRPDAKMVQKRLIAYVCKSDGKNVRLVTGDDAKKIYEEFFSRTYQNVSELKGVVANGGMAQGKVKMMFYGFEDFHLANTLMAEMEEGDILVAETTSPEIMLACRKAGAILTNEGGLLSHAAIVSREMNIPCIVGLGNLDQTLKDGDRVEVDANKGVVRILK